MSDTPRRTGGVGIYGGTFNPIHLGHLRAAEEVASALELERVLFVPSARPPHKQQPSAGSEHPGGHLYDPADTIASAELRMRWVEAAIAGHPLFQADPIEVNREGPSYLVDTLTALGQQVAPAKPVFILGRDAFQDMGNWREPRKLFTLADFAVTSRPPHDGGGLREWLPDCVRDDFELAADGHSGSHRSAGTQLRWVPITDLDISATELRRALRDGRSIRYLVPESIRDAIESSGVYAKSAP